MQQNEASSVSVSSLSGPAIANYTKNLPGAIGVKPFVAESPKVLKCSNQSDELQFNRELSPEPKGILASSILQEENKEANRDALMSNAQESIEDQLQHLIGADDQTKRPEVAAESSATSKKKQKPAGNYGVCAPRARML